MKGSAGKPFEDHVDRLIREAIERGEFDDLPGKGKPVPGAGTKDDEFWWLRDWVKREIAKDDAGESEAE